MTHALRLPAPPATDIDTDWRSRAACQDLGCDVFFHPQGERGSSRADRERYAKLICRRCPVARECLDHAVSVRELYGVWGGTSEAERRDLRRRRGTTGSHGCALGGDT